MRQAPTKPEEVQAYEAFQSKVTINKLPDAEEVKKMLQSKKDQKKGKKK